MTVEYSKTLVDEAGIRPTQISEDGFRVKIPLTVSVPCAESKAGLLKNYTAYCLKINDFGRQVEILHRFDDFAKLHEAVSAIPGVSLPPLPAKQLFGGNDPKIIEERRPLLEKVIKECVGSEKVLAGECESIYKFLGISASGTIVSKFLIPATREKYLPRLSEVLKPDADMYRIFNDSVIRTLLFVLPTSELSHQITVLEILQFILVRGHSHPLSLSVDVQEIFVQLGGIPIVWRLLCQKPELRELSRKVLSSLITSNSGDIAKFENLLLTFLNDQNGVAVLVESLEVNSLHEIAAKLLWFGLSADVQRCLANHPKGLLLLGSLFSSPDSNARCLAGLTLSVLVTEGALTDGPKRERAVAGVNTILSNLVSSSTDLPTQPFLSALCRGSPNGLLRIAHCMQSGQSPMSDFCAWVVLHAELPAEFLSFHNLITISENLCLAHPPESVIAQSCANLLFRLFSESNLLPAPRKDGRVVNELLLRVREAVAASCGETRKLIRSEYHQFREFSGALSTNQLARIGGRQIDFIDFTQLEAAIKVYTDLVANLHTTVASNQGLIEQLGAQVQDHSDQPWLQPAAELMKEWNASAFGMNEVRARIEDLQSTLAVRETESKAAEADSVNLQTVISSMRNEIIQVDTRAEEFRRESSRFATAAGAAVDADLMLSRAAEFEAKAKEQIATREALRQSQDSLEAQLAEVRRVLVQTETAAAEFRKALLETSAASDSAAKQHYALEARVREEMGKMASSWNAKLTKNKSSFLLIQEIFSNYNSVNKLIETENGQKDLVAAVIGDLVVKLQSLQIALTQ